MPALKILYSDNHLLVVDKPAGIATMGSAAGTLTIAQQAADYLKRKHDKPGKAFIGVVNRLDRLVSGVLVLARTSKAASRLSEQIREHQVDKRYLAMLQGHWPEHIRQRAPGATRLPPSSPVAEPTGEGVELVDWIVKDESAQRMRILPAATRGAQLAQLRVHWLAQARHPRLGDVSLAHIELLTGRKHQIRAQLSHYGMPVCGDTKYGGRANFSPGIALHCQQMTISHPTLKNRLTFRSSPANHWRTFPDAFGAWLE